MWAGGDNFTVSYTRGRIIEENHYYAFGLRIAGISSRKFDGGMEGSLKNDFLYNDKELWQDADLDWYDYGFRNYDAQIGRFTQLDPLTWDYPELTNYQYASNEPIANVDMDGLEAYLALEPIVISAKLPAAARAATSGIKSLVQTGLTAFAATASTFIDNAFGTNATERIARSGAIPSDQVNNWNTAVKTANEASIAFGMGEMFLGGKMMEGGGGAILLTGGASAEVSVPAIALGGAMALHGPIVMNNASRNLASGKGMIKSEAASPKKYEEPKTLKGGKQWKRDRNFGINDKDFWKWWEREGKMGQDIKTRKEALEEYNNWKKEGRQGGRSK